MLDDHDGDAQVDDQILGLTADIVSAHAGYNEVSASQLPGLIRDVHQALVAVGQARIEPPAPEPVTAVKKSVFANHILCLDCGKSFKMLKPHILSDHQMTPDEYRAKWGLPMSYPMVTAEYASQRSKMAKDSGLGHHRAVAAMPKKRGRPKKV
jgi:predicted transcriptional regulator